MVTMESVTQDIYGEILTEINRMQPKLSVFDTRFDADTMMAKFTTGNNEDAERLQRTFQDRVNLSTGNKINVFVEVPSVTRRLDLFQQTASKLQSNTMQNANFSF